MPSTPPELPSLNFAAPYAPTGPPGSTVPPDAFIDAPLGPDDMFAPTGPQATVFDGAGTPVGIRTDPKDFGGAIANSKRAINDAVAGRPTYPDYNLDGDRAYAWPCWDVEPPPVRGPGGAVTAPDPLDPAANPPTMVATVNAIPLP